MFSVRKVPIEETRNRERASGQSLSRKILRDWVAFTVIDSGIYPRCKPAVIYRRRGGFFYRCFGSLPGPPVTQSAYVAPPIQHRHRGKNLSHDFPADSERRINAGCDSGCLDPIYFPLPSPASLENVPTTRTLDVSSSRYPTKSRRRSLPPDFLINEFTPDDARPRLNTLIDVSSDAVPDFVFTVPARSTAYETSLVERRPTTAEISSLLLT